MRVKTVFLFLVLLGLSFFLFSQTPEELISQADKLYVEMKDMEIAQEALAMYRAALQEAEDKFEAYWKMSRIHYYIGSHTEGKKEKQIIFSQGIYFAKKAIVLVPDDVHIQSSARVKAFGNDTLPVAITSHPLGSGSCGSCILWPSSGIQSARAGVAKKATTIKNVKILRIQRLL